MYMYVMFEVFILMILMASLFCAFMRTYVCMCVCIDVGMDAYTCMLVQLRVLFFCIIALSLG